MTVISVGLMFVFALPTFNSNKGEGYYKGLPVGTLNDRKVTQGELTEYSTQLDRLRRLPGMANFQLTQQVLNWAGDEQQATTWFMLCKEADRYAHSYIS